MIYNITIVREDFEKLVSEEKFAEAAKMLRNQMAENLLYAHNALCEKTLDVNDDPFVSSEFAIYPKKGFDDAVVDLCTFAMETPNPEYINDAKRYFEIMTERNYELQKIFERI